MTDTNPLGDFEGRLITKTTIAVTNAGDGLSQALKTDPILLHQGDTQYVVLECTVGKVTFDPYDDGVCARVQQLKAGVATIIDGDVVKAAIDEQREKNKRLADSEKGQATAFDFLELVEQHEAGEHVEPADGCPQCRPAEATEGADITSIAGRRAAKDAAADPAETTPAAKKPRASRAKPKPKDGE
jgi:hypothetical protein